MSVYRLTKELMKLEGVLPIQVGDIIRHPEVDEQTVYYYFQKTYPDVVLEPISPGTELYTIYGAGCSYVALVQLSEPIIESI